jgi:hypothetical protein
MSLQGCLGHFGARCPPPAVERGAWSRGCSARPPIAAGVWHTRLDGCFPVLGRGLGISNRTNFNSTSHIPPLAPAPGCGPWPSAHQCHQPPGQPVASGLAVAWPCGGGCGGWARGARCVRISAWKEKRGVVVRYRFVRCRCWCRCAGVQVQVGGGSVSASASARKRAVMRSAIYNLPTALELLHKAVLESA